MRARGIHMYVWVKPFSFWAKSFMGETRGFLFGLFYLHSIWYFCNSWTFQTSYCVVQVAKFAGWERTDRVWILASSHSAKDDSFSVTHTTIWYLNHIEPKRTQPKVLKRQNLHRWPRPVKLEILLTFCQENAFNTLWKLLNFQINLLASKLGCKCRILAVSRSSAF